MKKLLPLIALLGLAGAAQAQVTIYGLIDASYGTNKAVPESASNEYDAIHFGNGVQGNSTTKLGFKGSADVGGGYKSNFQLEAAVAPTRTDRIYFNRQAWAGLSGGFGEFRAGVQDSVLFQALAGYDLNGAANDTFVGNFNNVFSAGRFTTQLAQYISPTVGGVTVRAGFTPKGNFKQSAADTKSTAVYALSAAYAAGPLSATVAYESKSTDDLAGFSTDLTVVAASYDFGVAKIVGNYSDGGKNAKGTVLGIAVPVAGASVGLQYSLNSDTKDSGTEFFANKEVLKNTYVYLDAGTFHKDVAPAKGDYQIYSVGMMFVF